DGAAQQVADISGSGLQFGPFPDWNLQFASDQLFRISDGIHTPKLHNVAPQMRPKSLHSQFAPRAVACQGIQTRPFGETFGEIGVKFRGDLAAPSLWLDDAGNGDELFYSKISNVKRLCSFMPAAVKIEEFI